ncbi:hypothetical protein ACQKP0_05480 [Heyndrickxia sp. NPDC080065]|uniref:hypothetical protein n=1 Tax=Heyndrickxia sp. NPDC080065 TaxID=3390568 RepID=UPI003D07F017
MGKWNKEAAPNNNLSSVEIRSSKLVSNQDEENHAFSEELSDGGERNKTIEQQKNQK